MCTYRLLRSTPADVRGKLSLEHATQPTGKTLACGEKLKAGFALSTRRESDGTRDLVVKNGCMLRTSLGSWLTARATGRGQAVFDHAQTTLGIQSSATRVEFGGHICCMTIQGKKSMGTLIISWISMRWKCFGRRVHDHWLAVERRGRACVKAFATWRRPFLFAGMPPANSSACNHEMT
jgi:hypothetical protein